MRARPMSTGVLLARCLDQRCVWAQLSLTFLRQWEDILASSGASCTPCQAMFRHSQAIDVVSQEHSAPGASRVQEPSVRAAPASRPPNSQTSAPIPCAPLNTFACTSTETVKQTLKERLQVPTSAVHAPLGCVQIRGAKTYPDGS